jgi:2-dehydro-3-deoxyglucarate aldolase/4-hydroxy-2-oxoheptanedioate aldolase
MNDFRQRVLSGEVLFGTFAVLGSALTTELLAVAGFDWVVVDLEHGHGDEVAALAQLQAIAHTSCAGIVRVPQLDRVRVGRALDQGAAGILVPRIETVEEACLAAEYCRYGGERGIARQVRAWRWGLDPRGLEQADDAVLCAVQIETAEALESVEWIAALDGVDLLFVGPNDLGHALGLDGGADNPALLERVADVAEAARRHGKATGVLVPTPEMASAYRELGFTVLGVATDSGLLAGAAVAAVSRSRRAVDNPPAAES